MSCGFCYQNYERHVCVPTMAYTKSSCMERTLNWQDFFNCSPAGVMVITGIGAINEMCVK